MGFQQGLSGLSAAAQNLDVIGNNVANANTSGFKSSRAQFADLYANALSGAGSTTQVGIGAMVSSVQQNFSQGSLTMTQNPMDLAINGNGFFRMSDNGVISFSRNGQFRLDRDGFIINPQGQHLTGYQVDNDGQVSSGASSELRVSMSDIEPNATTTTQVSGNLDSRATAVAAAVTFDPTVATSYNNATSMTVYDSLGGAHTMTSYFVKRGPNAWEVYGTFDGTTMNAGAPLGTLSFNSGGGLDTAASGLPWTWPAQNVPGADPLAPQMNFTGMTQYGNAFSIAGLTQDGYASGRLSGFTVSPEGLILGRYSNGETRAQGQIVLAAFNNPHGLLPLGNNSLVETPESGQPALNTPNSGTLGALQSGALEDSNVDLTQELVSMITAQRVYQANAQTIKAQDTILQTIVNLR